MLEISRLLIDRLNLLTNCSQQGVRSPMTCELPASRHRGSGVNKRSNLVSKIAVCGILHDADDLDTVIDLSITHTPRRRLKADWLGRSSSAPWCLPMIATFGDSPGLVSHI